MHCAVRGWPLLPLVVYVALASHDVQGITLKLAEAAVDGVEFGVEGIAGLLGDHRRHLLSHLLGDDPTRTKAVYDFNGFPAPYLAAEGDTLTAVADKHLLELADLRNSNPQLPDAIWGTPDVTLPSGLALNVRGFPAIPPLPTTISVRDSAVLEAFAAAYNISMEEFQGVNEQAPIESINKLTTLHVPMPYNYQTVDCPSQAVCVQAGQTLMDVATQLSEEVEELLASNPQILKQGGRLYVGQALTKPGMDAAEIDSTVTIHAEQSPYTVFLAAVGMPVTVAYLQALAYANSISRMEDVISISSKMSMIYTANATTFDLAVASLGCSKPTPPEPASTDRRKLQEGIKSNMLDFSFGRRNLLTAYRKRGLLEDSNAAPILSRLHGTNTRQLLSNDDTEMIRSAVNLEHDDSTVLTSAARRLFNMLHSQELVPLSVTADGADQLGELTLQSLVGAPLEVNDRQLLEDKTAQPVHGKLTKAELLGLPLKQDLDTESEMQPLTLSDVHADEGAAELLKEAPVDARMQRLLEDGANNKGPLQLSLKNRPSLDSSRNEGIAQEDLDFAAAKRRLLEALVGQRAVIPELNLDVPEQRKLLSVEEPSAERTMEIPLRNNRRQLVEANELPGDAPLGLPVLSVDDEQLPQQLPQLIQLVNEADGSQMNDFPELEVHS